MRTQTQQGFSLLELAISLAILALLSGGILKGREMIKSAKVQAVASDLNAIETAVSSFESRYSAMPGDFEAANAAGLGDTGGNGNGLIDNDEAGNVFSQLALSGFIQGTYTATALDGGDCPKTACLATPFGGTYLVSNSVAGINTQPETLTIGLGNQISASQLAELDRKLDDGNPLTGSIQVQNSDSTLCVTDGNHWDEANNPNCQAVYSLR